MIRSTATALGLILSCIYRLLGQMSSLLFRYAIRQLSTSCRSTSLLLTLRLQGLLQGSALSRPCNIEATDIACAKCNRVTDQSAPEAGVGVLRALTVLADMSIAETQVAPGHLDMSHYASTHVAYREVDEVFHLLRFFLAQFILCHQ